MLHRLDIHPVAHHLRCLVVFGQHLLEAARLAFGIGQHALAVALRLFLQARGGAARLRHHVVEVRLAFALLPLQVLLRLDRVIECGLHLFRRLGVLHGHAADGNAGLVAIENVLYLLLRRARHLLAPLVQHEVHLARSDHLAKRGLGRLQYGLIRLLVVEQVSERVLQRVLHGELDVDDVLVIGEHQRFLQHLGLDGIAVADLDRAHLGQVDDFVRLDRIRQAPAQARAGEIGLLAESEHHAALLLIDGIKAARQPHDQHQDGEHAEAAADLAHAGGGLARRAVATSSFAEHAVQLLIEVAPQFFEVGRPLIAAPALLAPLWVIK